MGDALTSMGINGPFLVSQIVNFLILFVVLGVFLWKPLMQNLDKRRQMLEKEKEDAEAVAEARANIGAERERALEEARGEAQKILAEARDHASALAEQAAREARQKESEVLAKARLAAEEERNRVLGEMRGQIAALAIAAAQKIIGATLDEQRQRRLIDEFFSGVRTEGVAILDEEEIEWAKQVGTMTAHVTTALPLSADEQEAVASSLTEHLGERPELKFKVDPSILGGLVIRIGDRVIDGSVASKLTALQERLG